MKWRWIIVTGLAVVAGIAVYFLVRPDNGPQKAVEETRRQLREQGFKTDLAEFDFSAPNEYRARVGALTNAVTSVRPGNYEEAARRSLRIQIIPDFMQTIGSGCAMVVWKQEKLMADENTVYALRLAAQSGNDLWSALRESFNDDRELLDSACAAAISGPFGFNLNANHGSAMLLPHPAAMKSLTQTLGDRTMMELHDGNRDAAWTNLFAATRLVTGWHVESVEISQLVRFACAAIIFNVTWQALQAEGWPDARLAQLQHEWESLDYFKGLPETAAFTRASAVSTCQQERQQPPSSGMTLRELVRAPRYVWVNLKSYWQQIGYRHRGTYEDERALLLYYRDREVELQRAVKATNWSEMRQLPGVTNFFPFQSKYFSRMRALMNSRQIGLATMMYFSPGQGHGLLGRASDAEARRRVLVTAIALERHRGRHGSYPRTLQELVPEFLTIAPVDFADGKPLRYRPTDDGHFVLYSIGVDGIDNGGQMRRSPRGFGDYGDPRVSRRPQEYDLVWPRPASAAEVEAAHRKQLAALAERTERDEELQAAEQWRHTAWRQAQIEKILAMKPSTGRANPIYHGRLLSQVLRNERAAGTNTFTFSQLLTLKPVLTGGEPEVITFETYIAYDVLTNIGTLGLYIDPIADEETDEDCQVGWLEVNRSTNGNCLLTWNTIYETPGRHALQMGLDLEEPEDRDEGFFVGPLAQILVTNLCQFSLSSAYFNPQVGAILHARLPESNGTYIVELTALDGELLKTIRGSTTNGIIKDYWDLTDDHGNRRTNLTFNSVFHITLPDSGRSQTLKGP